MSELIFMKHSKFDLVTTRYILAHMDVHSVIEKKIAHSGARYNFKLYDITQFLSAQKKVINGFTFTTTSTGRCVKYFGMKELTLKEVLG